MKLSVVTISFNQAQFLEACLDSVAGQAPPWEHIIVDPGSTDGSREIIKRRSTQFASIVLAPDNGPADGLNKGFACANGDIFYYLNSDDIVAPGTFAEAREAFALHPHLDVISGNADVIDETGQRLRRVYSDPVSRHRLAHAGGLLIQPATFIRRVAFERAGGFNTENRSNWDGELITDLFISGARFGRVNKVWAGYRLHADSITASARMTERIASWADRRYEKLMGRPGSSISGFVRRMYQLDRILRHPDTIVARLRGLSVYGSKKD